MNPKATQYANSKVPNADRNDAPYFTSSDRWQDVYEAYEAGEKGQESRIKELEEKLTDYEIALKQIANNTDDNYIDAAVNMENVAKEALKP